MSVLWTGAREVKASLEVHAAKMDAKARQFVQEGTLAIQRKAQENANTGAHKAGLPHLPGTGPGPNVVRGLLRRSITTNPPVLIGRLRGWYAEVGVATAANYANFVDKGTSRMPPYPYFSPAVKWAQDEALPPLFRRIMSR